MNGQSVIVGGLSDFKENQGPKKSLLERIEQSSSVEEIEELLKLGSTYKKASVKTLKMWVKAAAKKSEKLKSR